jgi:hypothetical protein
LKKIDRPPSVKEGEIFIAENVYDHEAYIYRFINLLTGMIYLGYHLGDPYDEYWHSSTCEEFGEFFCSSTPIFRYEIIHYGTKTDMKNKEHQMLKEVDAKNNPKFYNKSNGSPANEIIRNDVCLDLADRYEKGEFNIGKISISVHQHMAYKQVRDEDDMKNIIKISDEIDRMGGNSDKCDPVLVLENGSPEGDDYRIGGNHTVQAGVRSKHCKNLPTAKISKELLSKLKLTEAEITFLGLVVNKNPEIIKKTNSEGTIVKWLVDNNIDRSIAIDSDDTVERLKQLGLTTSRERRRVIDKAKDILSDTEMYQTNKKWKKWKKEELEAEVSKRCTDNTVAFYMSSGRSWGAYHKLVTQFVTNPNKLEYILVLHHKSQAKLDNWEENEVSTIRKNLRALLESMVPLENEYGQKVNRKFTIHTLETKEDDTKKKDS